MTRRRRWLVALGIVGLAAFVLRTGAAYAFDSCAQQMWLRRVLSNKRPDQPRALYEIGRHFRRAVGPAVHGAYYCEEGGWLDHPFWLQFETTDTTVVDTYLAENAGVKITRDTFPQREIMLASPPWFDPPRDSSRAVYMRSGAEYHLWFSPDKKRVWFHFFDH